MTVHVKWVACSRTTISTNVGPLADYCKNRVGKLSLGMGSSYSQLAL